MSAAPKTLNRLKQAWRERRPTFGAIATIPSIQTMRIMAQQFDWIIVDLEHGPIDLATAHGMIMATAGTPCVPLVRIAANEPHLAKAPMDIGALGINFPMILSRTDTVVLACTHYPLLTARYRNVAPWPVTWIDPAPAIARRVADLLGPPGVAADHTGAEMIFTSNKPHQLRQALMPFFGGRVPA